MIGGRPSTGPHVSAQGPHVSAQDLQISPNTLSDTLAESVLMMYYHSTIFILWETFYVQNH